MTFGELSVVEAGGVGGSQSVTITPPTYDAGAVDSPYVTDVSYSLGLSGVTATGLQTTAGNYDISLVQVNPTTINGVYNGSNVAFTISLSGNQVTLTSYVALEHSNAPQGEGEDNTLDLGSLINVIATVSVTDGDNDQIVNSSSAITPLDLTISDTEAIIGNPQNLILTNQIGNTASGVDLDVISGADTPVSLVLTPEVDSEGYAINTNDVRLTSTTDGTTYFLKYVTDSDGKVTAYQYDEDTDSIRSDYPIFTLTPDLDTGTYTATYGGGIDGILDGASQTVTVNYNTGGYTGGNDYVLAFPIPDMTPTDPTDNLYVVVTAADASDDPLTVNYNASSVGGLGVEDGTTINSTEFLTLNFTNENVLISGKGNKLVADPDAQSIAQNNPLSMSTATFALTKLDVNETASWSAYSGGVLVASGTVDGTGEVRDMAIIASAVNISTISIVAGTAVGGDWSVDTDTGIISFVADAIGPDKSGQVEITYEFEDGTDYSGTIYLSNSGSIDMSAFDSVIFTAIGDDKVNYSILSMEAEISSETSGTDHTINVQVDVTDADNDVVTDYLTVTFDANGDITGTEESEVLVGGTGNDSIIGGGGDDILMGKDGDDILIGGAGDDAIDGGLGDDTVSYEDAPSGVTVDLGANTAMGGDGSDTLSNIENVIGSDYNDSITGDGGDNMLSGGLGDDTLIGGAGNDTLIGEITDTEIDGGLGTDTLMFSENTSINFDTLVDNPMTNIEIIDLNEGTHTLQNISLDDVLEITGQTSNTILTIVGDDADTVTVDNTTLESKGQLTIGEITYDIYNGISDPTVELRIQQEIKDTI